MVSHLSHLPQLQYNVSHKPREVGLVPDLYAQPYEKASAFSRCFFISPDEG